MSRLRDKLGSPETVALASYGLSKGIFKSYIQPELTATRGWLALGVGVLAYEAACPPTQTLSEGVDRALDHKRLLTTAAVGITALHLLNVLPEAIDPYQQAINLGKRFKDGRV